MPRKAKDKTEIIEEKSAKKSTTKLLKKGTTSKSNLNKEVSKNSKKTISYDFNICWNNIIFCKQ